ncbi:hypothetical protein D9M69_462950 [compost metagenome]
MKPDVRIESTQGGFFTKFGNPARTCIVGSEGEQGLVQVGHGLLAIVLVDHPTHILDPGINVWFDFSNVADAKFLAGGGHDLHDANGAHLALGCLIQLRFLVPLGGHQ